MATWRCAVAGIGSIAQSHLRAIARLPEATVAGVISRNREKTQAVLDSLGVSSTPIFPDVPSLCQAGEVDVIHICTPSGAHLEPALAAIALGKHVIVEKPLEITLERVDAMLKAARSKGVRVAGIFQNRWNPANQAIKQAMEAGRFGKVAWAGALAPWYRSDAYYASSAWRGTWGLDGGGAVMNQGIHQVDLMQWIMGPVKTVSAMGASRIHEAIEVEDTLTAALTFASGAFGTFMSTTAMYPGGAARFEVGGAGGTAVSENGLKAFEFQKERPEDKDLLERLRPMGMASTGPTLAEASQGWMEQNISAVLGAWSNKVDAPTEGPIARQAVAIVVAMYESMRAGGKPITLLRIHVEN